MFIRFEHFLVFDLGLSHIDAGRVIDYIKNNIINYRKPAKRVRSAVLKIIR